jgi:hypothetical protein
MMRTSRLTGNNNRKRSNKPFVSGANAAEYQVGPGRPPKEFQFKPGQSGNPKGTRRKKSSIARDIKASLERALNKTVTLKQGEKEQIVTKAQAGIEQLVNQFAKGDRYARRDLIDLAKKFGVDLTAGQSEAIEHALGVALTANDAALLADYVRRHRNDDAALAESKDTETPSPTNPSEKET